MNYKIALIRGDGIGPEVVGEAVKVMEPSEKNSAIPLLTLTCSWAAAPSTR